MQDSSLSVGKIGILSCGHQLARRLFSLAKLLPRPSYARVVAVRHAVPASSGKLRAVRGDTAPPEGASRSHWRLARNRKRAAQQGPNDRMFELPALNLNQKL